MGQRGGGLFARSAPDRTFLNSQNKNIHNYTIGNPGIFNFGSSVNLMLSTLEMGTVRDSLRGKLAQLCAFLTAMIKLLNRVD